MGYTCELYSYAPPTDAQVAGTLTLLSDHSCDTTPTETINSTEPKDLSSSWEPGAWMCWLSSCSKDKPEDKESYSSCTSDLATSTSSRRYSNASSTTFSPIPLLAVSTTYTQLRINVPPTTTLTTTPTMKSCFSLSTKIWTEDGDKKTSIIRKTCTGCHCSSLFTASSKTSGDWHFSTITKACN